MAEYPIWFPAVNPIFERCWDKNVVIKNQYDTKWFNNGSFFRYPNLLTTAFNNFDDLDYRTRNNISPNVTLLGDSGGFQLASYERKGINITVSPIKILQWLEANCDIGMNLDFPLVNNFNMSLKKSLENFTLFETSRTNYDMILCNVLHGRTYKELLTWYNNVKDFNFDGWAIGVKPIKDIYFSIFAYLLLDSFGENLTKYCHFFGMGNVRNAVAINLLYNKFKKPLGFDSSSFAIGSTARKFFLPGNFNVHLKLGSQNSEQKLSGMPCDCPVCSNVTIDDIYEDSYVSGLIISLHNLYQSTKEFSIIKALSNDDYNLNKYIYHNIRNDMLLVCNVTNMINDYFDQDIDYVYKNYNKLFIKPSNQVISTNLSRFK